MQFFIILLMNLFLNNVWAADEDSLEMDDGDLEKKAVSESSALLDEQRLKVQENLLVPVRTINLRQIQNEVLNLNMTEKELQETDTMVED